MANLKPYGDTSSVRLANQINKDNSKIGAPTRRLGIDYTFGLPETFAQAGLDDNTKVRCTPVPGTHFKGPEYIYYTRLTLALLMHLPYGYIKSVEITPGSFSIHQILPEINRALGLDLQPEEVVDAYFEEDLPSYPLRIVEAVSLAWLDSEFEFSVIRSTNISLFDAIPHNVLSGLTYPPQ